MTALPNPKHNKMTEAEYLEFERESEFKYEYLGGEIFAMVGASREHNLISNNVGRMLGNELLERLCEVYQSDMRVKAVELYTYPDIVVVCGEVELQENGFDTLLNPTVIMEILSPSTEAYDRGDKFRYYRKLKSLREYILISQEKPLIDQFILKDDEWRFDAVEGLDAQLELPSIKCTLHLSEIYRKVNFD